MVDAARPPWHYWPIAAIGLLWNAFGAFDYTMTNTRNADYLKQFPPEMIDYIDAIPTWAMATWAIGVWGAVLGSLLMLLRSRFAVHAFAASLLGLAGSTVYQQMADIPGSGSGGVALQLAIWAGAILLLLYAIAMRRRGVLR